MLTGCAVKWHEREQALMTLKHLVPIGLWVISVSVLQPQNGERLTPTSSFVWRGGFSKTAGSVSSDGRYISYIDWTTANLCLRDSVNDDDRPIIAPNNPQRGPWKQWAEESVISRDGKRIAYTWAEGELNNSRHNHELWVANVHGEPQPKRLYADSSARLLAPRDWSADGKWIERSLGSPRHCFRRDRRHASAKNRAVARKSANVLLAGQQLACI
jgi:hypothetical protein